jgi:hypothetical protein
MPRKGAAGKAPSKKQQELVKSISAGLVARVGPMLENRTSLINHMDVIISKLRTLVTDEQLASLNADAEYVKAVTDADALTELLFAEK